MKLSDHDLRQLDEARLDQLSEADLRAVSRSLLADLKEARDRLNRTPSNSSVPPSSRPVWAKPATIEAAEEELVEVGAAEPTTPAADTADEAPPSAPPAGQPSPGRKPGKQPGAPGHGRTQKLVIDQAIDHRPDRCALCARILDADAPAVAFTGWDEIDVAELPDGNAGLKLQVIRHRLYEITCPCGHHTRASVYRGEDHGLWDQVEICEWRLVGARLAALIVYLKQTMRLSYRLIREFLWDLLGLHLSLGTLDQTVRESARAAEALEAPLMAEIRQAALVYADETPWPESALVLYLWVLMSTQTVVYLIGPRSREIPANALGEDFAGWLMSDGYSVYRAWRRRLRCWAHLLRKAQGLSDSTDAGVAAIGQALLDSLSGLMDAIYAARAANPEPGSLMASQADALERLKTQCETHRDSSHPALRAFSRELLYDWEAIMRPVEDPLLPLTNNAAESALRPAVIQRRLMGGTRCESGSRSFALLASVMATCRRRGASAWRYLATVIAAARKGLAIPALPPAMAPA